MGVVNMSPDSFSATREMLGVEDALAEAEHLVSEGADVLDIGGESTRPGAEGVSLEVELSRVIPVVRSFAQRFPTMPLSVDTSKPEVARQALAEGAHLVNDITGLREPEMRLVIAKAGAAACLMHMRGEPRTMQDNPEYDDVVQEVSASLENSLAAARASGIHHVLVDPGIGFGKTVEHNLALIAGLENVRALGAPVLLGTSRKRFLGALTGIATPSQRNVASAVSVAIPAAAGNVDMVRVHDVKETREALAVADAFRRRLPQRKGVLHG